MQESTIVIGDIHGCWLTLQALLKKLPHDNIILVGDLIDRGPRSREVVDWAVKNKIRATMGNHEHMLLLAHLARAAQAIKDQEPFSNDSSFAEAVESHERECFNLWWRNGGDACLKSYDPHEGKRWSECIPYEHIRYIAEMPDYIIEGKLLVSHTGHALGADCIDTALWARGYRFPKDDYYRVFGHSVVKGGAFIQDRFANIDTGSFIKPCGRLTAIEYPSLQTWEQQNID